MIDFILVFLALSLMMAAIVWIAGWFAIIGYAAGLAVADYIKAHWRP